MPEPDHKPIHPRSWYEKFRDAFRGVRSGMRGQSSFKVHIAVTVFVVVAAALLRCTLSEWCILLLCVGGVLTAEMFNSAIEHMAKAIDRNRNPDLGEALDTASAAVLFACVAAGFVGAIVFIVRIVQLIQQ